MTEPTSRRSWLKSSIAAVLLAALVLWVGMVMFDDDMHRAQVSEAISLLSAAKQPLAEYYNDKKVWPRSLGTVVGNLDGRYVGSLRIERGAGSAGEVELVASMRETGVNRRVAGKTVKVLSVDGGKTWTCRGGTMEDNYLPASCRQR